MDNPGVIYGCLHIYPVMLWTILGSSMVVYIYIQSCCGQSWGHLWLSPYISSNAVDNPGVIYVCLHIYQYCCGQPWGHLWLSSYISSNTVDNIIIGSSMFVQSSKFVLTVILLRTMAIELVSMYTTSVGTSAAFFFCLLPLFPPVWRVKNSTILCRICLY